LILPGVLSAAIMGFAKAMGEFGATITFVSNIPGETQTLALAVYSFLQLPGGEGAVLTLVAVSLFISLGAVMGSEVLARRIAKKIGSTS